MKTRWHGILTKEELDFLYHTLLTQQQKEVGLFANHLVSLLFPLALEFLVSGKRGSSPPWSSRTNGAVDTMLRALYQFRDQQPLPWVLSVPPTPYNLMTEDLE